MLKGKKICKRLLGQLGDLICERFGDEKLVVVASAGSEDDFVTSAVASANELPTRKAPAKIVKNVKLRTSPCWPPLALQMPTRDGPNPLSFVTRSPPRFSRDTDVSCRFVWAVELHKMLAGGSTQDDGGFLCSLLVVAGCVREFVALVRSAWCWWQVLRGQVLQALLKITCCVGLVSVVLGPTPYRTSRLQVSLSAPTFR